MIPRYIDADDFLDLFYVASAGQDKEFVKTVELVVEDAPTADVAEVKHGKLTLFVDSEGDTHMEENYDYLYECSVCKTTVIGMVFKFCPWCGAKMDGETE